MCGARRRRHGRLLQHRDGRERREGGAVEQGRRHRAAVEHGEGDIVGRAVLLLTILLQRLAAAVALFGAHAGGQQAAGSLRGTTHRQGIVLVPRSGHDFINGALKPVLGKFLNFYRYIN